MDIFLELIAGLGIILLWVFLNVILTEADEAFITIALYIAAVIGGPILLQSYPLWNYILAGYLLLGGPYLMIFTCGLLPKKPVDPPEGIERILLIGMYATVFLVGILIVMAFRFSFSAGVLFGLNIIAIIFFIVSLAPVYLWALEPAKVKRAVRTNDQEMDDYWQCPHCKTVFKKTPELKTMQVIGGRTAALDKLLCSKCGEEINLQKLVSASYNVSEP